MARRGGPLVYRRKIPYGILRGMGYARSPHHQKARLLVAKKGSAQRRAMRSEQPMRIKDLSASEVARLSALLDEAIDLAPAGREEWLGQLQANDPRLVA